VDDLLGAQYHWNEMTFRVLAGSRTVEKNERCFERKMKRQKRNTFRWKMSKWYYLAMMDAQSLRKVCTAIKLMIKECFGGFGCRYVASGDSPMGSCGRVTQNCVKHIRPVCLKWGKSYDAIRVQKCVSCSLAKCIPFNRTDDCVVHVRGVKTSPC
jgi:hypothetical protein